MKATAMMFNGDMMRAHLQEIGEPGTGKRMTRRVMKPDGKYRLDLVCPPDGGPSRCPYGKSGDLLWFRETMRVIGTGDGCVKIRYEADRYTSAILPWPARLKERPVVGQCLSNGGPREFSRMTGLITAVRAERLQHISEEDAKAEGAPFELGELERAILGAKARYRDGFRRLWSSIYGHENWGANPWVWVIEYKPMLINVDALQDTSIDLASPCTEDHQQ